MSTYIYIAIHLNLVSIITTSAYYCVQK